MRLFQAVAAIALNTFRETVRDRIIYAFMLFAFVVTVLSILLGSLSVGQDLRILEDTGLACIAFIGGIIAVFAGTNLVYKELERRTVYLIFTKPVSGWQFILGKYAGLSACVLLVITMMGAFLLALVYAVGHGGNASYLVTAIIEPLLLVYVELLFVIAVATFFSTFASPVMSVIFTLSLWLIGHFGDSLKTLGEISQNHTLTRFLSVIYYLIPDLSALTKTRSVLMVTHKPETELISYITCYVFAYVLLLLFLASAVTERKEFT